MICYFIHEIKRNHKSDRINTNEINPPIFPIEDEVVAALLILESLYRAG